MNDSLPNGFGTKQPRLGGSRSAVLADDDTIGRRLKITASAYTDWANERMAEARIGLIPWVLLGYIDRAPQPGLSQKDLAAHFGVGSPTIVGHVDKLAAEGLVERVRDRDDRRVTRLAITDDGRDRLADGGRHARELEEELRIVLGERRLATFMSALKAIHTHVSAPAEGDA